MSKHTPGPWTVQFLQTRGEIADGCAYIVADVDGREVVISHHGDADTPRDQNIANAYLIAAAQDLLDAVIALDKALCDGFDTNDQRHAARLALIAARAAVAKAEGRS